MCGKPQVLRHRSNITTFMRLVPVNVTMPFLVLPGKLKSILMQDIKVVLSVIERDAKV